MTNMTIFLLDRDRDRAQDAFAFCLPSALRQREMMDYSKTGLVRSEVAYVM